MISERVAFLDQPNCSSLMRSASSAICWDTCRRLNYFGTELASEDEPVGVWRAECHLRRDGPIRWRWRSCRPGWRSRPPEGKWGRCWAGNPRPPPAAPAPGRTRRWRNCISGGRSSCWRPSRRKPTAPWRCWSRTRPVAVGSVTPASCNPQHTLYYTHTHTHTHISHTHTHKSIHNISHLTFHLIQFHFLQFHWISFDFLYTYLYSYQYYSMTFNLIPFDSIEFDYINMILYHSIPFDSIWFHWIWLYQYSSMTFNFIWFDSVRCTI